MLSLENSSIAIRRGGFYLLHPIHSLQPFKNVFKSTYNEHQLAVGDIIRVHFMVNLCGLKKHFPKLMQNLSRINKPVNNGGISLPLSQLTTCFTLIRCSTFACKRHRQLMRHWAVGLRNLSLSA
jgi:hypothetical protein